MVVSYDKLAKEKAKEVLLGQVRKIYQEFDWRQDRNLVRNIFVYDGLNGGELPGQIATSLGHDARMRVNLLACGCDWKIKQRLANSTYVDLFQVECSGRETLGMIADVILGIRRPEVDYKSLPMSIDRIVEETEKFQM